MPSGKRLLEDFILPSLDTETFGHFMEWVDSKEKDCFKVLYHHKNGHNWSKDSADVFVAWDRLKGRTQDTEDYFTKSRQRFRVALAKCPRLEKIPNKGDKHVEIFRILSHKKQTPKRELVPNIQTENIKPELRHTDDYKTLCLSPSITFYESVPSVITRSTRPPTSVIVSPEDIRQQRRLSLEGITASKLKEEANGTSKIKTEIKSECVDQPTQTEDLTGTQKAADLPSVPLKMVHRIPVVPVPDRTTGVEMLKCRSKTAPQVIKYVSFDPKLNMPYFQMASSPQHMLYGTPLSNNADQYPSTEKNRSLLNIQRVQKLE